jgi:hypothetical protein
MEKGWKYCCFGLMLFLCTGYTVARADLLASAYSSLYADSISWDVVQSGDIIFQTSLSEQSKAIMLATGSPYSHCGIIWREHNQIYVWEAVQPVKKTLLKNWIAQGMNKTFHIKRLRHAQTLLDKEALAKMKVSLKQYEGKPYDAAFAWTNDRMYCSELVYKVYEEATGLKIGRLQKMKELHVDHTLVRSQLKKRYGNAIPWEMLVLTPAAIAESELLVTVK